MEHKSVIALVVSLALFIWLSAYYVIINAHILNYGYVNLYEPTIPIIWVELFGSIGMVVLGFYVLIKFLRRKL